MGRYSNPDIVARLRRILSGHGRDRVSHRPVPSLRQKQTRLTDSQRSELVARYERGESSNALAREFGIDRRTATRIIRTAGAELRYRVGVDVEKARALYEAGLSLVRVGEALGVSAGTVLNLLRRSGTATRQVGTNQWSRSALSLGPPRDPAVVVMEADALPLQPMTDGVITIRAPDEGDVARLIAGREEELRRWLGRGDV